MFEIVRQHDFLVAIDSDGCAFDTMELKHKECFIPHTINSYNLQAVSKYAREAAEFVNLYSKSRGINRFPALVETLQWLQKRPAVIDRNIEITIPAALINWIETESKLGNPALATRVQETNDPALQQALAWSEKVNETVAQIVRGVPPFPGVRECLEKLSSQADQIVCSATPNEALRAEWSEHGIDTFVQAICGQETGTKKQTLANAAKYDPNRVLMIGDAPGDYRAAAANQCLFFPINPAAEEASWKRLLEEGIEHFLNGTFAGNYQAVLLKEFDATLPDQPPWPVVS
ncbi:MAG: haloacid dehalogenase [Planctomycetaceae bacterium]|nr:haloacid dehalogenase [Planctomycetaceae bacterium]HAA69717.1 haloacid dehalogenase [Planctomycetaceae bacterium]